VETTSIGVLEEKGSPWKIKSYTTFISDCIDVTSMKGHAPKSVEDRVLKGMILKTILRAEDEHLELTSEDIHNYISTNEFYFESPETDRYGRPVFSGDYTYDNLPGIRSTLTYLRHAGYIVKSGIERPFTFLLTTEGHLHAEDTFFKYKMKMQYMQKLVDEIVSRTLNNDENVNELAESKKRLLCKTCKLNHPKAQRLPARTWTVKPHRGKIGLQGKDDSIREYEITEDDQIKELADLKASLVMKDGKVDAESTIMTLQNEKEYLTGVLREAGIRYEKLDTAYMKEKGRKGKADAKRLFRNMTRMEVAHAYYEAGMYLDAEFFEIWGGDQIVIVEYKRTVGMEILNVYYDIQSTKSEIMTRTDLKRRILEPEEIPSIGIYVSEIRPGSVIFNSEHFQAPKTLAV